MGLFRKEYMCLVCGHKFKTVDERVSHVKVSHSEFDSKTLEKPCKNCKDGIMRLMHPNKSNLPAMMNHFQLVLCQKCGICEFYHNEGHFISD